MSRMKAISPKITARRWLNQELISQIKLLNAISPEYELYYESHSINGETAFFTAIDGDKLIGFLSFLWVPNENEAELTAFVHPSFRKHGIFTQMLDAAFEECQRLGIIRLYYSLPHDKVPHAKVPHDKLPRAEMLNAAGSAKNKSHQYSYSEYLMKLNNYSSLYDKDMLNSNLERLNAVYKSCCRTGTCSLINIRSRETLCRCQLADEKSFTNIYNVETHPAFRCKGLATLLMQCVISDMSDNAAKPIILQVSSRNTAACRLYKKLGFEQISRVDYYLINCPAS